MQEASLKIISVPAPDILSETISGPPAVDSLMKDGIRLHPQAAVFESFGALKMKSRCWMVGMATLLSAR